MSLDFAKLALLTTVVSDVKYSILPGLDCHSSYMAMQSNEPCPQALSLASLCGRIKVALHCSSALVPEPGLRGVESERNPGSILRHLLARVAGWLEAQ